MTAVLVIVAIVIVIALFLIVTYNGMVRGRNKVDESWSGIDVQLKRRHDLVPNLVETVKGYATHEREVFQAVTDARTRAMSANSPAAAGAAEGILGQALGRLFAVAEAYPDLKASTNFLELQGTLNQLESEIAASRRVYNSNVQTFNTRIQSFPGVVIAGPVRLLEARVLRDRERRRARERVGQLLDAAVRGRDSRGARRDGGARDAGDPARHAAGDAARTARTAERAGGRELSYEWSKNQRSRRRRSSSSSNGRTFSFLPSAADTARSVVSASLAASSASPIS